MIKNRNASDNVENLFSSAKVLNLRENADSDSILLEMSQFLAELDKKVYDKLKIIKFYNALKPYITISEVKGKLFSRSGFGVIDIIANGVGDWKGFISFNWNNFTNRSRSNTAWFARQLSNNILCLIEVENKDALRTLNSDRLFGRKYDHHKDINDDDSNGINLGLLSTYPIKKIKSHIFNMTNNKSKCSRNCLEVELELPDGRSLFLLLNHLKRNRYTSSDTEHGKFKSGGIHNVILNNYNLLNDLSLRRA